ncbi:hypothetical protein M6B38_317235 [Iris pallida]|uniref:Uncharacterized protein n=1 Tax=Iris pallida TaxID=29817 RepID=A0AAX6HET8_IRIPA|nr:hypothetical protein M6B38_317235 [Iris pallida]
MAASSSRGERRQPRSLAVTVREISSRRTVDHRTNFGDSGTRPGFIFLSMTLREQPIYARISIYFWTQRNRVRSLGIEFSLQIKPLDSGGLTEIFPTLDHPEQGKCTCRVLFYFMGQSPGY